MKRSLEMERIVIYRERNFNIRAMGFGSYADYLKSDLWLGIRSQKLKINPTCEVCDRRRASQVHHMKYRKKDLEGRDLRWLVSICNSCHYSIEFTDGVKITPKMANTKLKIRRRKLANIAR